MSLSMSSPVVLSYSRIENYCYVFTYCTIWLQDKTLRGFRHVLRGGLRGKELRPARTRPLRGDDSVLNDYKNYNNRFRLWWWTTTTNNDSGSITRKATFFNLEPILIMIKNTTMDITDDDNKQKRYKTTTTTTTIMDQQRQVMFQSQHPLLKTLFPEGNLRRSMRRRPATVD